MPLTDQDRIILKSTTDKPSLCVHCQRCCRQLHFQIPVPPTKEEMLKTFKFFKARGIELRVLGKSLIAVVPHICPQLTPTGCSIYADRPEACRQYDGTKDEILKDSCLWSYLPPTQEKDTDNA